MFDKSKVVCVLNIVLLLLFPFMNINSAQSPEKMRIAILNLQPEGVDARTTKTVSDLLRTELFNTGLFIVIERQQMDEILKEQEFQQTGCTETECAVEIGKLLSANKILVGTIGMLDTLIILNVRVVDVEKGIMEIGETEKCISTEDLFDGVSRIAEKIKQRLLKKPYKRVKEIEKVKISKLKPKPKEKKGKLIVKSEPIAILYIDNTNKGKTTKEVDLTLGYHKVKLYLKGYDTFRDKIYITPDKKKELNIKMKKDTFYYSRLYLGFGAGEGMINFGLNQFLWNKYINMDILISYTPPINRTVNVWISTLRINIHLLNFDKIFRPYLSSGFSFVIGYYYFLNWKLGVDLELKLKKKKSGIFIFLESGVSYVVMYPTSVYYIIGGGIKFKIGKKK